MKNKIIIAFAFSILIIFLIFNIVGNKKDNKEGERVIKVSEVTRSVFYAPQYVAISNGYFKEEGIDVELTTGQGADAVMTSVLSNQVQIGFAGPEASIYVYNEGKEDYTQIFAQMTKRDGAFLISRDKKVDFKIPAVKGSTIIPGRKGGVPYMTFEYLLKENGIDTKKDVNLDDSIKFDLMAGAFTSGKADYVTLFEPTASLIEKEGKGYIVTSIGKESGEIPYTAYFAKKSYIEKNKELIQGFTNAIYKGEQWVKNHTSEEIAEKVKDFFPDTDIKLLSASIQRYKNIDAWSETPVMKEEPFNKLQEVIKSAGELKKYAPFENIVNNEFSLKAEKTN